MENQDNNTELLNIVIQIQKTTTNVNEYLVNEFPILKHFFPYKWG